MILAFKNPNPPKPTRAPRPELLQKFTVLQKLNPGGARLVELLIDDILSDIDPKGGA